MTVNWHALELVQASVAVQLTVLVPTGKVDPEDGVQETVVAEQVSFPVTEKVTTAPAVSVVITLMFVEQLIVGAVVSTSVTVWLQSLELLQASVARHVRMASKVLPQWPVVLVTVLRMVMVTVPQVSLAVGASKRQGLAHSTLLLGAQAMLGAVVSTTVTVWLHSLELLHASVARQVRVASKVLPQWPVVLVTVLTMVTVTFPQVSLAVGASNVQPAVHSTLLLGAQAMLGAVVSTTV